MHRQPRGRRCGPRGTWCASFCAEQGGDPVGCRGRAAGTQAHSVAWSGPAPGLWGGPLRMARPAAALPRPCATPCSPGLRLRHASALCGVERPAAKKQGGTPHRRARPGARWGVFRSSRLGFARDRTQSRGAGRPLAGLRVRLWPSAAVVRVRRGAGRGPRRSKSSRALACGQGLMRPGGVWRKLFLLCHCIGPSLLGFGGTSVSPFSVLEPKGRRRLGRLRS